MAFAIFYELADASAIAGSVQSVNLTPALRNRVKKFWDAGLRDWASAPAGAAPGDTTCPLCRIIVMDGGGGPNDTVTLANFRQLLYDVAAFLSPTEPAVAYLIALADDMAGAFGAQEPWPPA